MNIKHNENICPHLQEAMDKFDELKTKEHSQEYKNMMKIHKKEWENITENVGPWEWSYGLDALVEHLRWMRDYYKLGENVWGMEKKDEDPKRYRNVPTRLQTLEETLFYYDSWMNLKDEYIKVINHQETYKEHDNNDGTVTIENLGFHCKYKYGSINKTYKKLHKEETKYKKKFFKMLYKYIEEWWD